MSEPRDDTAWAERLMKAERENRCGDTACMTRRTAAAIRVLTGGKEHQDYCWAVETFEVEMGLRDPETVGAEPSNAMLDAALREQEPGEARYFEPGCVFCEKATGNTDRVMVFEPLNPVTPGHLLVVPTAHARDATEWPDITAYVMERAAEVARAAGPCNLITSVGPEATQSVFHLHVHVVPRRAGDGLALPWSEQEPGETLRAADLRRALRANRHAPDIARDPMANQWNRGIDRALEIVDRLALEADRNPQETERAVRLCRRRAGDGEECGLPYGHDEPHHPRARVFNPVQFDADLAAMEDDY